MSSGFAENGTASWVVNDPRTSEPFGATLVPRTTYLFSTVIDLQIEANGWAPHDTWGYSRASLDMGSPGYGATPDSVEIP